MTTMLTSDGYSIHTIELKIFPDYKTYEQYISYLYNLAKIQQKGGMYPMEVETGEAFCCKLFSEYGMKIYFTRTVENIVSVKAVINPRKMLDPCSGYLGILPANDVSVERFAECFTDIMREADLPELLEDWLVTRVDLCVNLDCGESEAAKELNRLVHKGMTPAKYRRVEYSSNSLSAQKLREKQKHYLCFKSGSSSLVIYDKKYQMTEEGLITGYDRLTNSILRVELQTSNSFLRRFQEKQKIDTRDTAGLLQSLISNSDALILKRLRKSIPYGVHYKPNRLRYEISLLHYHADTIKQMQTLAEYAYTSTTFDDAVRKTKKKYALSEKEMKLLLRRFQDSNISPIPLHGNFPNDCLPSLTSLLTKLAEDDCTEIDF